jgi:ribosomal protein L18
MNNKNKRKKNLKRKKMQIINKIINKPKMIIIKTNKRINLQIPKAKKIQK